jgi:O-antigen/teichoic acid export membrane protein
MGIIKRQGLKTAVSMYIGVFLGLVFINLLFPHYIAAEYLGLLNMFTGIIMLLSPIPSLGMQLLLIRSSGQWTDDKLKKFHGLMLLTIGLVLLIICVALVLLKPSLIAWQIQQGKPAATVALFKKYYYTLIPLLAIFVYNTYLEVHATRQLRTAVPTFLREVLGRIILIAGLGFICLNIAGYSTFQMSLIASYGIPFVILIGYVIRVLPFSTDFNWVKNLNFKFLTKEELSFSFNMLLLTVGANAMLFMDSIIVPAYLGLKQLAIYSRPLLLGQMVLVPTRAVLSVAMPVLRDYIAENNTGELRKLYKGLATNLYIISALLVALLCCCAEQIFELLPPEYSVAKPVLYIIAVGRMLDAGMGPSTELLTQSKYYKPMTMMLLACAALTLLLNVLLIPKFGLLGPAYSVSISLVVFNLAKTALIKQKLGFTFFTSQFIPITLCLLVTLVALYFVPAITFISNNIALNALVNIGIKCSLAIIIYTILIYKAKVSTDVNQFINLVISGKIFKGGHKMDNL